MRAIDSHIYFWKYDPKNKPEIGFGEKLMYRDYLPESIAVSLRRNEVDAVIAVTGAASELETHFLIEMAKTHPIIRAVIGWLDCWSEDFPERFDYFRQYSQICGLRTDFDRKASASPGDEFFRSNLPLLQSKGWTMDVKCSADQRSSVLQMIADFPEQHFVLDNFGSPELDNQSDYDSWQAFIKELSTLPNCSMKLAGLFTQTAWKKWSAASFYPYFDLVFETFGTRRLLFGSDWPALLLSGSYLQWKSLTEKYLENFPVEEQELVLYGNAQRVYSI